MSNPIRRLAACLLFVLLPLQAFAGAVAASQKPARPAASPKAKPPVSSLLPNAVRPLPKIFRTVAIDPQLESGVGWISPAGAIHHASSAALGG
jgi:hypothetical protein